MRGKEGGAKILQISNGAFELKKDTRVIQLLQITLRLFNKLTVLIVSQTRILRATI